MKFLIFVWVAFFSIPIFSNHTSNLYAQDEELTDSVFPRTDPKIVGLIYQMLEVIDLLFTKYDIPYWIDGGTVLGAIRHEGIIPWDDDADLCFHIKDTYRILRLKKEFARFGFHLEHNEAIRLFPSKRKRYPYIDIVGHRLLSDNTYNYNLESLREVFPNFYWLPHEIHTLVRVKFGPIMLNAPSDMMRFVFTGYGPDCLSHATFQTHHGGTANELTIKEKVRIVDFSPAAYDKYYIPLVRRPLRERVQN